MASRDALPSVTRIGTLSRWTKSRGIYRGEVLTIMGALADIGVNVRQILAYIEGDDEDEEEEEDLPDA